MLVEFVLRDGAAALHEGRDDLAPALVREADLDRFCRTSGLATFKRPRRYVFVEAIPKSPVGKLLRRKLVAGEYEIEHSKDTAA